MQTSVFACISIRHHCSIEISLTCHQIYLCSAYRSMILHKFTDDINLHHDNPVLKYANQLQGYADFMGVNLEQFMDILENQKKEAEMSKYTQKGVDQETAQKIVELERKVREQDNNLSEIHNREELKKEIENFRKEYPTINLRDVPEEVFKIKESQGISLSLAYRLHQASTYESEIKSLKEKLNIRDEESQNSKLSTGSLTGGNDNANMGSLTPDAISKMSDKDFIKNRDIIWKGITS